MNPYQHAIDTQRITLNDTGLLAWVKHNREAIDKSLTICRDLENLKTHGITSIEIFDDGQTMVPPIYELQVDPVPVAMDIWLDAEGRN